MLPLELVFVAWRSWDWGQVQLDDLHRGDLGDPPPRYVACGDRRMLNENEDGLQRSNLTIMNEFIIIMTQTVALLLSHL